MIKTITLLFFAICVNTMALFAQDVVNSDDFESYTLGDVVTGEDDKTDAWFASKPENSIWERFYKFSSVSDYQATIVEDAYSGSKAVKMVITPMVNGGSFKLRSVDLSSLELGETFTISYWAKTDAQGMGTAQLGTAAYSGKWHDLTETYQRFTEEVVLSRGRIFFYFPSKNIETPVAYNIWIDDIEVKTGSPTGIKEDLKQQSLLHLYPNPVQNKLFVTSEGHALSDIEVLNTLGQSVVKGKRFCNALDISALENGCYFLKVKVDRQLVVRKFVKQ